jgi:putative oxidoreductase
MKALRTLFKTDESYTPLIARLALGLAIFPHGAQKALGWFGGYGFGATMNFFTGQMHIPALFAFLAITAEFAGAIGLITGFISRVAAFGIATTMLVAAILVHVPNGFFMNWLGNQKGEGFEYHILALGLALIVIVVGGGKWSVDSLLSRTTTQKSDLIRSREASAVAAGAHLAAKGEI